MGKTDFFNELLQRIPRQGMPRASQKIFPHVAKAYIEGRRLELSKRNRIYAEDIYKRLDKGYGKAINGMRIVLLKRATDVMTGHPKDLLEDSVFAHTMIRYYVEFVDKKEGLTRKLAKAAGVKLEFLKNQEYNKNREELKKIAKRPSFYNFLFNDKRNGRS